jgi:catechol 2,3-dioxygenase-like lactoylglutathione lyase family enzyme
MADRCPSVKVTRMLHHSVNVEGELAQSVEFYQRLFGMPDEARPRIPGIEGHWFGAGNAQLHLVDAPAGAGPIRPAGPHVCFAVADLEDAIVELDQAGVPYVRGAQGTTIQIWFADPAGNTIEIQQDADVERPVSRQSRP